MYIHMCKISFSISPGWKKTKKERGGGEIAFIRKIRQDTHTHTRGVCMHVNNNVTKTLQGFFFSFFSYHGLRGNGDGKVYVEQR